MLDRGRTALGRWKALLYQPDHRGRALASARWWSLIVQMRRADTLAGRKINAVGFGHRSGLLQACAFSVRHEAADFSASRPVHGCRHE